MALVKNDLKTSLLAMMNDAQAKGFSKDQVADAMATAIDNYVRQGVISGISVTLADGTQASQSGSVTLQ
jgi:hypothetical protein